MKWSEKDLERFKANRTSDFKVISVDGNIVIYSHGPEGKWKFKARLLRGGKAMAYTVHTLDDNRDLFE